VEAGCRVRLVNDPGRIGVFTGKKTVRGDRDYLQVASADQTRQVPFDQVELVDDLGENSIELLRRGRMGLTVEEPHLRAVIDEALDTVQCRVGRVLGRREGLTGVSRGGCHSQ